MKEILTFLCPAQSLTLQFVAELPELTAQTLNGCFLRAFAVGMGVGEVKLGDFPEIISVNVVDVNSI